MGDDFSYERWPDIEAENQRVSALNRCQWIDEAKHVPNETLLFMIRQIGRDDEEFLGTLLLEMSNRTVNISTRCAQHPDPIVVEQIARKVDLQILELVLSDKASKQLDFLEVAFSLAVERRTIDALRNHNRSAMGRRGQIFFHLDDQSGIESDEVERALEFAADGGHSPENVVLLRDFYQKACAAVKDARDLDAVILFHVHGWPVESKDPRKPDLAHYFDESPRQVRYRIEKAMDRMKHAVGIGVGK